MESFRKCFFLAYLFLFFFSLKMFVSQYVGQVEVTQNKLASYLWFLMKVNHQLQNVAGNSY